MKKINNSQNYDNYKIILKDNICIVLGLGGTANQTQIFCYYKYKDKEFFGIAPSYNKNTNFFHSNLAIVGAKVLNIPFKEINNPEMWNTIYFGTQMPRISNKINWRLSYLDCKEPPRSVQDAFEKLINTKYKSAFKRPLIRSKKSKKTTFKIR
ncbi:MAG: hypothetical protein PHU47_00070 [Candidatus ainarchaeum sp.]|nr:hypothetical protein [Candidatus ainarchaeum sp.]